jgi:hypothetical protein
MPSSSGEVSQSNAESVLRTAGTPANSLGLEIARPCQELHYPSAFRHCARRLTQKSADGVHGVQFMPFLKFGPFKQQRVDRIDEHCGNAIVFVRKLTEVGQITTPFGKKSANSRKRFLKTNTKKKFFTLSFTPHYHSRVTPLALPPHTLVSSAHPILPRVPYILESLHFALVPRKLE